MDVIEYTTHSGTRVIERPGALGGKSDCTIYFIGPENGPIKIGFARRLPFRLRELELANAYPLHVWASVEADTGLETHYHKLFKAHRLHGEWFDRHPSILAEIERLNPTTPAHRTGVGGSNG